MIINAFIKKTAVFFILLCAVFCVNAQTNADFMFSSATVAKQTDLTATDEYVRTLSIPASSSIEDAAKKICANSANDYQKARAIFAWVAQNVSYDMSAKGAYTADDVWKKRSGVAAGYCALYLKLARAVGLDGEIVSGIAKNASYQIGSPLPGHTWLIVHNGSSEILMDPAWGAGTVSGGKFVFSYNPIWFDVDPYIMAAVHFPDNEVFQYLNTPVTASQFRVLEPLDPMLSYGGIDGRELYNFFIRHPKASVPSCDFTGSWKAGIKARKLAMSKSLKTGQSYVFKFDFPADVEVKIFANGTWTPLKTGTDITVTPADDGGVMLAYKAKGGDRLYPMVWYRTQAELSFPREKEISAANSSVQAVSLSASTAATRRTRLRTATQNSPARLAKDNSTEFKFTMTDGRTMNSQAAGKPKILVIGNIDSSSTLWTVRNIAEEWQKMPDADFIFYDAGGHTKEQVTAFKKNIPETKIQFAYTADKKADEIISGYRKLTAQTGSVTLPMIVYVDGGNKVQAVEWGRTFEGSHLNKILQSLK